MTSAAGAGGQDSKVMQAHGLLQHRYPFVFLDQVEIIKEGVQGRGLLQVTHNQPFSDGEGLLSPVLLVEAMAQLSGIVVGRAEGGMLAGIKDMEFSPPCKANGEVTIESALEGSFGGFNVFMCTAHADGETLLARGKVTLYLGAAQKGS